MASCSCRRRRRQRFGHSAPKAFGQLHGYLVISRKVVAEIVDPGPDCLQSDGLRHRRCRLQQKRQRAGALQNASRIRSRCERAQPFEVRQPCWRFSSSRAERGTSPTVCSIRTSDSNHRQSLFARETFGLLSVSRACVISGAKWGPSLRSG